MGKRHTQALAREVIGCAVEVEHVDYSAIIYIDSRELSGHTAGWYGDDIAWVGNVNPSSNAGRFRAIA